MQSHGFGPVPLTAQLTFGLPSDIAGEQEKLVGPKPHTTMREHTSEVHRPCRSKARDPPKLLPHLAEGSEPIVVASLGDGKMIGALLGRKKIERETWQFSKQAQVLAGILGGETATWLLASIMISGRQSTQPIAGLGDWELLQIRAKVLCVDFVESQQVRFKLTASTIEAITEYHRDRCRNNLGAHSSYGVDEGAEIEVLTSAFEQAISGLTFGTGTDCLEDIQGDGSGELPPPDSSKVKSAILKLFEPLERYRCGFPELL